MRARSVLSALFALLLISSPSAAAPGALQGTTISSIPGGDNVARRAAVQADGKIVVAGEARKGTMQLAVARFNADGSPDAAFGDGGAALARHGPGDAEGYGLALQADGKIVVAGQVTSDRSRFAVARFNADGTLDATFGGGVLVLAVGSGNAGAFAVAVQPDGKILLGGYSTGPGGRKTFTLVRYNANASLDQGFGTGGIVVAPEGSTDESIRGLGLQSDGKIVAAGPGNKVAIRRFLAGGGADATWATTSVTTMLTANGLLVLPDDKVAIVGSVDGGAVTEMGVLRMTAAGAPDTGFGTGNCAMGACPGVVPISAGETGTGWGLARQSDGKLVVSGNAFVLPGEFTVFVERVTDSGAIDTGFGGGHLQPIGPRDTGYGLALRSDDRIVVAGHSDGTRGDKDTLVVSLTAAGAFDTTFNGTGFTRRDYGSMPAEARASVLQADGKVVLAGLATPESYPDTERIGIVARYLANGAPDTSFGTAGLVEIGTAWNAVAMQADGRIVAAGYVPDGDTTAMAFARLLADGTPDNSFGSLGIATVARATSEEQALAVAVQPDGKIVGAGYSLTGIFLDSLFVRLTSGGSPDAGFNTTGRTTVVMSTGSDQVNAIALQADGKIVGAGWADVSASQASISLTRLGTDGIVDSGFGGGTVITTIGSGTGTGYAVAIQPDGKIVAGGRIFTGTTDDFVVVRYLTGGTLDAGFGTGGIASNDFGNHNRIYGLARLASGKIVGAGVHGGAIGIAQYTAAGQLDRAFANGGNVLLAVNGGLDYATSVSVGADGTLYLAINGSSAFGLTRVEGESPTKAAPNLAVASSANPSSPGQSVTFSATASGASGTPTGTVLFRANAVAIAGCTAVPLAAGVANCSTNALALGTHAIDAIYSGDATYNPAASPVLAQVVAESSDAASDMNGDGRSDMLWFNASTGQFYRMFMNGFAVAGAGFAYTEPNTAWKIVADADFNGDGVADLLWRNATTGQVYVQVFGSNGLPAGGGFVHTEPNADWRIVHTPDLNGDGRADLLWWNATTGHVYGMLLNGASVTMQNHVYREANTAWKIVAVGDYAGSGKRNQLLWRNGTTGQVFLMTVAVNGGSFTTTGAMVYQEPNTAWRIAASADFNGDGRSDILWRNASDGRFYMMLMNGGAIATQGFIYTEANTAWNVVATGDYNGDGKADLLWRNDATGHVYMMLMNGLSIAQQAMVYREANTAWKVMGPWEYGKASGILP